MARTESQYSALAFAGATPFLACALLPLFGIGSLPLFGALDVLAAGYGLAILCFLCGTHWTIQLRRPQRTPFNLLYTSNAIFLVAWFTYVLASPTSILAVQIPAFLALLWIDHRLLQRELVTGAYFGARAIATSTACLSLLILVAA